MNDPPHTADTRPRARLTLLGRIVRLAALFVLLLGLLLLQPLLIRAGLFALVLLAVAFPLARLNLSHLSYSILCPDTVCRNEGFEIELRLLNSSRCFPAFDIEIQDDLLRRIPVRFPLASPSAISRLPAIAHISRRGIYTEFAHTLLSRFPFGLVSSEQSGISPVRIVVCPPPRLPPDFREALEQGLGHSGYWHTRTIDLLGEFKTVREFQPGDRMKLVSWPFSARLGKLIVKEMEQPGLHQCTVVFHSYQPPHSMLTRRSFEKSLSLLSGLFSFFHDNFIPFRFVASFLDWNEMAVLPDTASRRRILTVLATARMVRSPGMETIRRVIETAAPHSEALLIVSNTPVRLWTPLLPRSLGLLFCMDNRNVQVLSRTEAAV